MSAPTVDRPSRPAAVARHVDARRTARHGIGIALGAVSLVLLGVCLQLALVSQVSYARDQQTGRYQFRIDLARGTAVVAQYSVQDP